MVLCKMTTTTETSRMSRTESLRFPLHSEALVVEEPKADFKLMPITLDEVRADELLVEMKFSGICHTVGRIDDPMALNKVDASMCNSGYSITARPLAVGTIPSNLRS